MKKVDGDASFPKGFLEIGFTEHVHGEKNVVADHAIDMFPETLDILVAKFVLHALGVSACPDNLFQFEKRAAALANGEGETLEYGNTVFHILENVRPFLIRCNKPYAERVPCADKTPDVAHAERDVLHRKTATPDIIFGNLRAYGCAGCGISAVVSGHDGDLYAAGAVLMREWGLQDGGGHAGCEIADCAPRIAGIKSQIAEQRVYYSALWNGDCHMVETGAAEQLLQMISFDYLLK